MKKTFVLDTNVLLTDPNSLTHYINLENSQKVVIPNIVIKELDTFKDNMNKKGYNARLSLRLIEQYLDEDKISVEFEKDPNQKPDDIIVGIAEMLKDIHSHIVCLITNDLNMRCKAKARGIESKKYSVEEDKEVKYNGYTTIQVSNSTINDVYAGQMVFIGEDQAENLYTNEYVILQSDINEKNKAVVRFVDYNKPVKHVNVHDSSAWGIKPKNYEQYFAIDALLDPDIQVVSLIGIAGSGKTLLAVAAGVAQVFGKKGATKLYDKMIVSRPIQTLGNDIGFLPGPQPLDAKIATPKGWTTMGQLSVGDFVMGRDGKPTKIEGVYPKGEKDVYRITTSDGTSTECCEDHLWLTYDYEERKRGKKGKVRSTKQMMENLVVKKGKRDQINFSIPRNEAVHYEKRNLRIPPYTLGVLLGDGHIGNAVSFSSLDSEIVDRVRGEVDSSFDMVVSPPSKGTISYGIVRGLGFNNNKPAKSIEATNIATGNIEVFPSVGLLLLDEKFTDVKRGSVDWFTQSEKTVNGYRLKFLDDAPNWTNPLKNELGALGLVGKRAWEKFIPEDYKYSSVSDRLSILRGLMDTDGTVKANGEASYCTTSRKLAEDVVEIVRSLGGRATVCERDRAGKETRLNDRVVTTRRKSYEFTISLPENMNPFHLKRKADMFKCKYIHSNKIVSIELIGKKKVQCIKVDNKESLYLTDNFIVTHNTMEEKLAPWTQPIIDNLEVITGNNKNMVDEWFEKGKIEVEALAYIRGRSINNCFMIIDEAQNLTPHEIKTILTRVGMNTKIILTGDIEQIDNSELNQFNNGLTYAVEKLKEHDITAHVTFTKGERSRVAEIAAKYL